MNGAVLFITLLIQKELPRPQLLGTAVSINGLRKTTRAGTHCHQRNKRLDQAKTPTKRQRRMHLAVPQSPQKLGYLNKNDSISIDGYMYFPELRLFIDNPKDVVDIHALAGMNNEYEALWHCVPSESKVLQAKMRNLHPQRLSCSKQYYKLEKLQVSIPDMWGRTGDEDAKLEDVIVDLYTILKRHKEFDTNRKGYNDLSPQEIRKGYIFEPVLDGHVSVVIAPEEKDSGHSVLVLLRFNESFHGGCTKLNDWQQCWSNHGSGCT